MSRNGSGTYNLPAGNPVVTGTTISSSWANTTMNDIANAITGSIAADGQTPITANLNLNNNKLINVADPSNNQDAATKSYTDTAVNTASALALLKASNLSDVANATTARTNLSAAKSGANSDITSITGLTTALAVNQGGTGTTTPSLVAGTNVTITGTWPNQTVNSTTNGTVTSVATGNGLQGGTITTSGTLSVACPTFNTVGSYCFVSIVSFGGSTSSGSNYAAGGSNGQISSGATRADGITNRTDNLSGTWKWMGSPIGVSDADGFAVGCRVS